MTTKVTITTHTWPVAVTTNSSSSHSDGQTRSYGHQNTTQFVPKDTVRDFYISNTLAISVTELPEDATGLYSPTPASNAGTQDGAG